MYADAAQLENNPYANTYNMLENGNYTEPDVFRRRYHRLLEGAGIESKELHSLRHTFATNLVNGVKQPDGTVKALTVKQVADLLGHSTTQVTEMYYVKRTPQCSTA